MPATAALASLGPPPSHRLAPGRLSAVDLADVLLLGALRRHATAIVLAAGGDGHLVTLEEPAGVRPVARLPAALGDAVVARLALRARLDVARGAEQVGRLLVAEEGRTGELILVLRPTTHGLGAELRRLAAARDLALVPAAPLDTPAALAQAGYRVESELGQGGMGVVYRGEHVTLGRPVAVKVLHRELAANPAFAERFVREARAASRTRHPGIIDVTDFGTLPDGRAFLVMELCEAETLEAVLKGGALPVARALRLGRAISAALGAAHAGGVVHRDLKPANVFVLPGDAVKLADFGAASLTDKRGGEGGRLSDPNVIFGTPQYMSPEHARGEQVDARTDLYALGCVLFEMVSGRVPYDAGASVEVLLQHLQAPVPAAVSPHGPLPRCVPALITRALAKDRAARHQSADELGADLEQCLAALARPGWRRWLP